MLPAFILFAFPLLGGGAALILVGQSRTQQGKDNDHCENDSRRPSLVSLSPEPNRAKSPGRSGLGRSAMHPPPQVKPKLGGGPVAAADVFPQRLAADCRQVGWHIAYPRPKRWRFGIEDLLANRFVR